MQGKIVVITGELAGIGLKAVEEFISLGAKVILWSTSTTQNNLNQFPEANYEYYQVDIADYKQVAIAGEYVFKKYKKIDILINNAHAQRAAQPDQLSTEQWQKVIDINLTAVFNCIKVVAPYMVKNKFGRIINATSMASIYQSLDQTNYDATKSGLHGITSVWARELTKHGITVNAVYSGFIEPDAMDEIPKSIIQQLCAKIPAGRLGKAEEIAKTYKFLASDEASYMSGAVMYVDGGYFA